MHAQAYFPDYRLDSVSLDAVGMHITDAILFSVEPSPSGDIAMFERFSGVSACMDV
jgi:hypothetical protein